MRFLLTISLFLLAAPLTAGRMHLLLFNAPLAGSQYYALGEYWLQLRVGDRLVLIREPDNKHDPWAIRVEWQGHKLGYIPRSNNRIIARALDAGEPLTARISRLRPHPDPWQRVELEVLVDL